jgi:CDP-6-deoxy-D-xylo-4-hexulose-3-dehydrase
MEAVKGIMSPDNLSKQIEELVSVAYSEIHKTPKFICGETPIPATGKVFGTPELESAVRASLDFWLTAGPYTEEFESKLAKIVGMRNALMVNSGSSANLLAISSLTSPKHGENTLKPGDEVITVAAGFPTTVTPILQNGLIPVYVDIDLSTYVANDDAIEAAISPKTRAIIMAHTLGNPFNLDHVTKIAEKHKLWLIEDSCDALGGTYKGRNLGSFGDLSTFSFYPAHHITTGEGGAVLVKKAKHKPIVESFRDWGRDCWCPPGVENTCLKRYEHSLGQLPTGYDHKYTYSHLGYNLKSGDIQASIGLAQLNRLPVFTEARKSNWKYLFRELSELSDLLILPNASADSDPSWFGFAITVKSSSKKTRNEIVRELNSRKIGTRLLFGGNLLRQPAFLGKPMRIVGNLDNTDLVAENTFWIGVWPGLSHSMLEYVVTSLKEILKNK